MGVLAGDAVAGRQAATLERPLIYSVNPAGNGDFIGAPESGSDFIRYEDLLYQKMPEAGGRSVRAVASWRKIEPTRGEWDWSSLDRELDLFRIYNVEPVILIVNISGWVSPTDQPAHEYPPREEFAPQFSNFITKLARRCKGQVRYYEFWNEPNGYGWNVDRVDNRPQYNRADEYVPRLFRCYKASKAVDPDAQVAMGGFCEAKGHARIFVKLAYEMRRDMYRNEKFWDAIATHLYNKKEHETAETAIRKLDVIREIAARYGDADIPLWITEYGWHSGHLSAAAQARGTRDFLERFAQPDQDDLLIASRSRSVGSEDSSLTRGVSRATSAIKKRIL